MSNETDNIKKEQVTGNEAVRDERRSKDELMAALKKDFATTVNRVYINSLGKEYGFREVTVKEQKSMSRIMIGNENRKDVVYDAQCALINSIALDHDFDIYKLTEFDRIKLLMTVYQASMYDNKVEFTCKQCGAVNSYNMDFSAVVDKLDSFDISDRPFVYSDRNWKFDFTVGYPTVSRVAAFYRQYMAGVRISKENRSAIETNLNMDYINLFIKSVRVSDKDGNLKNSVDMTDYGPLDVQEIISVFPQDIIYSDGGVLKFIADEFVQKMNRQFEKHQCWQCKAEFDGDVGDVNSFL